MRVERRDGSLMVKRQGEASGLLQGEVYSYTLVQDPPAGFEAQAPYLLALVRLDRGDLITAQLTDVEHDIQIGERVEMVTRKLTTDGARGIIVYGYKFRPLVKRAAPEVKL